MEPRFFDTHCHLDLMLSPDATANESAALGLGLFDCGIDPCDFEAAKKRASRYPNIIAGVGRCKYSHLTGSAIRSCSILLPDA